MELERTEAPDEKELLPNQQNTYVITRGALWKRIGIQKLSLVVDQSKTDPVLETLLMMIRDSEYIHLQDPEFQGGLEIMKEKGLFTQEDVDRVKQPAKPEELPGV